MLNHFKKLYKNIVKLTLTVSVAMQFQQIVSIFALMLILTVYAKPLKDQNYFKKYETKLEDNFGSVINQVTYGDGGWLGFTSCELPASFLSCDLSIHVNGRRIDQNHHDSDETVFQSCYQSTQSIGLSINNFNYDDVQSYACLSNGTIGRFIDSAWLFALPIVEVSLPGVVKVGSQATFTCNSYSGTPLYWVLPGEASQRTDYSISQSDNGVNSSTTLTFKILDNDNFADFWCCAKEKPNQQTVSPCTPYTLEFQRGIKITTQENYPTNGNWSIACEFQGYPDPTNVSWTRCSALNICFNYPSDDQVSSVQHSVTSTVAVTDKSTAYYYVCSASNSYGTVSHTFDYPVENNYAPIVQYNDKVFYTYGDGYIFKISFTVKSNPAPNIYWNMQNFWSESKGSVRIPAGKSGRYEVVNSLIDIDTYDSSLIIYNYVQNADQATFACIAENDNGLGFAETEAEIGPNNVALYVCNGANQHVFGETVDTMLLFSGFPPPNYEVSVVADNDIDYSTSEYYYSDSGLTAVTISFLASSNNPHVQINGSAFFPYVLFTNQLTVEIDLIAASTTTSTTVTTPTTTTGPTTSTGSTPTVEITTTTPWSVATSQSTPYQSTTTTLTTTIPTTPPTLCPIR